MCSWRDRQARHPQARRAISRGVEDPAFPKTDGFPVWTEGHVAGYEKRWPMGTRQRLWLDVLLYTGLRRGHAMRFGRQHGRNDMGKERLRVLLFAAVERDPSQVSPSVPANSATDLGTATASVAVVWVKLNRRTLNLGHEFCETVRLERKFCQYASPPETVPLQRPAEVPFLRLSVGNNRNGLLIDRSSIPCLDGSEIGFARLVSRPRAPRRR
jgi:hypothetical protein